MRRLALALAALALLSCSRRDTGPSGNLRLGYFPNVTHAQALVGVADGTFARALGGRLETRVFGAGPAAMEALISGDLDAAYVGPGPAAIAYLRTRGEAIRVVAGGASGGSVLVVKEGIGGAADLAGKRVGTPQLGNTQDVALRTWLRAHGLRDGEGPKAVRVTPLASADLLALFARGDLAGAWVTEPWGARLVAAGGRVLVDERTLWEAGRFPTTVLAVSRRALETRRQDVEDLVRAHLELTGRWEQAPEPFADAANAAFARITGKALSQRILSDAFSRLEPLADPLPRQLVEIARRAQALGFAPAGDVSGMVDGTILQEIARR